MRRAVSRSGVGWLGRLAAVRWPLALGVVCLLAVPGALVPWRASECLARLSELGCPLDDQLRAGLGAGVFGLSLHPNCGGDPNR